MKYIKKYNESMVDKKIKLLEDLSIQLTDIGLTVEIWKEGKSITMFIQDLQDNSGLSSDNYYEENLHEKDFIKEFDEDLKSFGMNPRSKQGGGDKIWYEFDKWSNMTRSTYLYESKEEIKPKLELSHILYVQDCFRELEDNYNIIFQKSYYDIETEDWFKTEEISDIQYSIDFYITSKKEYEPLDSDDLEDVISSVNRAAFYIEGLSEFSKNFNYNIQYREVKRHLNSPTDDREISKDDLDGLLNKEIFSVSFCFYSEL